MQGVQYRYSDRADSRRGYELPEGDWSVEVANRKATAVFCDDSEELDKIRRVIGSLWNDNVPVGPIMYLNERVSAGGVQNERYLAPANRTKAMKDRKLEPGIFLKYNDISEMVREEENEMMRPYANGLDLKSPSEKLDAINAVQLYNEIFRRRLELGLRAYFERDERGNKSMKFLRKKNDNDKGIEVSREYVDKAIDSLNSYYVLSRSDDWNDLKEAECIAKRFFTEEGKRSITRRIYNKAVDLAEDARAGRLDAGTSKQIYVSLVKNNKTNDLSVLAKAADIARLYMPDRIAEDTEARLRRLKRLDRIKARGVCLDGNSETFETIVSLEKRIRDDLKLGKTRQIGELTTRLRSKAPILYLPVNRPNPVMEVGRARKIKWPKNLRSRKGFTYEKGITQQEAIDMVAAAEKALKIEFKKNGGNVLTKRLEWPSEKKREWNRARAEKANKCSTLPPHPENIPVTLVRTPKKVLAKIREDPYRAPPTIVRKAHEISRAA